MTSKARTGQQTEQQTDQQTVGGTSTEARAEAARTATLNLPFVTAQFRAPDLHVPSRDEIGAAARGARSMLPSRKAMLFYGGLAVTAAVGAIEWPVAAAIGVGTAVASRGGADPRPVSAETPATGGSGNGRNN
jgi:hypothetical protein